MILRGYRASGEFGNAFFWHNFWIISSPMRLLTHSLRFQRFILVLITGLTILFTSPHVSAQNYCSDLFAKPGILTTYSAEMRIQKWLDIYESNPKFLYVVASEMLHVAKTLFRQNGVVFESKMEDGVEYLLILPSPKTDLNRFADLLQKNYSTQFRFSPTQLLNVESRRNCHFTL